MAKPRKDKFAVPAVCHHQRHLLWAIISILICALIASVAVVWISQYILNSFQDSNAMVGLITDAGLVFDDKNLEGNLSNATRGLVAVRDFGTALIIGLVGVGLAIFVRSRR